MRGNTVGHHPAEEQADTAPDEAAREHVAPPAPPAASADAGTRRRDWQSWRLEVERIGGRSPLASFVDTTATRIELSTTHPGGLAQFITGRPTALSSLIRDDLALRVAVQPGGCSGLRYQLFFDERTLEGDVVKDFSGVNVVTDRMSAPYLMGATIDFVDTIEKQGFTIDNPNAGGSCACGDSFH